MNKLLKFFLKRNWNEIIIAFKKKSKLIFEIITYELNCFN